MMVKDGVAYLQVGGGIVFDSDSYDEWMETMNKLDANIHFIVSAKERFSDGTTDEAKDIAEGPVTLPSERRVVHLGVGS